MKKHKIVVYDSESFKPSEKEISVGDDVTSKLKEIFNKENESIKFTPMIVDPKDLSVLWGIMETINGKTTLTHRLRLTNEKTEI